MRYYRYGADQSQHDMEHKEKDVKKLLGRFGELVIEEDTIYELDKECLQCKKKKKEE